MPTARLHVFDDGKAPITGSQLRQVEGLVYSYERTTFERRGNLNGRACILGQLECYQRAVRDGIVCKVDCDTMLFRPGFLPEAFRADPNLLGAGIRCPMTNGFWGPFYGYRAEALEPLARLCQVLCPTCRLPEDLTLSGILRREAPGRARVFETGKQSGYFTGYNYRTALTLEEYIRRFHVITFGARFTQWKAFLTTAQQREWQGETMRLALKKWLKD
jgi:hypothetical protein